MAKRIKISHDEWSAERGFDFKRGDCTKLMKTIPDGAVDLILTDPPYGNPYCDWDYELNFEKLWKEFERILTDNGTVLMFSSQRFTATVITSKPDLFKYFLVWLKKGSAALSIFHAKNQPLIMHEEIVVFSRGKITHESKSGKSPRMVYNPVGAKFQIGFGKAHSTTPGYRGYRKGRPSQGIAPHEQGTKYPKSYFMFPVLKRAGAMHPTQKPVKLLQYLIAMFSNSGQVVFDPFGGVASTIVAAMSLNRIGWGAELDAEYYRKGVQRIANFKRKKVLE